METYYENNAPCYQDRTPPPPRRAYYIREERDRGRVVSRPYRREHTIRRREEYHNSDRRGRDYYRRDDNIVIVPLRMSIEEETQEGLFIIDFHQVVLYLLMIKIKKDITLKVTED